MAGPKQVVTIISNNWSMYQGEKKILMVDNVRAVRFGMGVKCLWSNSWQFIWISFLLSAKNDIFITRPKKGEKWLNIKSKENKACTWKTLWKKIIKKTGRMKDGGSRNIAKKLSIFLDQKLNVTRCSCSNLLHFYSSLFY